MKRGDGLREPWRSRPAARGGGGGGGGADKLKKGAKPFSSVASNSDAMLNRSVSGSAIPGIGRDNLDQGFLGGGGAASTDNFFLPNNAPASPSSSNRKIQDNMHASPQAELLPDVAQSTMIRQALLGLQRRVESGMLPGVQLELVDLTACRCIALCKPDLQIKGSALDPELLARSSHEDLSLRVIITFSFRSSDIHKMAVPQFALVPQAPARSERLFSVIQQLRMTLGSLSPRLGQHQTEAVLGHIVFKLTQCLMRSGAVEADLSDRHDPLQRNPSAIFAMEIGSGEQAPVLNLRKLGSKAASSSSSATQPSKAQGAHSRKVSNSSSQPSNGNASVTSELAEQPCPRYCGATFSGPGLLVFFDSRVDERLRALRGPEQVEVPAPRLGLGKARSPNGRGRGARSLAEQENPDARSQAGSLSPVIRTVPRTFNELSHMLDAQSMLDNEEVQDQSPVLDSLHSSQRHDHTALPAGRKGRAGWRQTESDTEEDIGIVEELTSEDLCDWDLRAKPLGQDPPSTGDDEGPAGTPTSTLEPKESLLGLEPGEAEMDAKAALGKAHSDLRVTILDTSLLSPVNRFLGRAARLGTLDEGGHGEMDAVARLEPRERPRLVGLVDTLRPEIDMFDSDSESEANSLATVERTRRYSSSNVHLSSEDEDEDEDDAELGGNNTEDSWGMPRRRRRRRRRLSHSIQRRAAQLGLDIGELESGIVLMGDEASAREEIRADDPDAEEGEESYASLLCWYDDFVDEPVDQWAALPVGLANMYASRVIGRFDLVHSWLSLSVLSASRLARHESAVLEALRAESGRSPGASPDGWARHPCGRGFLDAMFAEYSRSKDVQTLAIVTCVLQAEAQQTAWAGTTPLLSPRWKSACDRYRRAYADILHRWGLNTKRAEVMKYVKPDPDEAEEKQLYFSPVCPQCRDMPAQGLCPKAECRALGSLLNCVICQVGVRGFCTFCPACGHGGHSSHMDDWFKTSSECPTGCGCQCGREI